jgi:hypothetical protein
MRWKSPPKIDYFEWHPWFAWRPVETECNTWVWLERVMRRHVFDGYDCHWEYQLPTMRLVED